MVISTSLLPGGNKKGVKKKNPKTVADTPEHSYRSPPKDPAKDKPKKEDAVKVEDSPSE